MAKRPRMFEKLSHNLNLLMAEARISASQLGKNTGLPATTIKRMRNDGSANPTLETLLPIAKFFGISVSQLIGEELLLNAQPKGSFIENRQHWSKVPILSWEAIISPEKKIHLSSTAYTTTDKAVDDHAYALVVQEESWQNLAPGTVLIVNPTYAPAHRDFAIVHIEGQKQATLKQVLIEDGKIYLKSMVIGLQLTPFTEKHKFLGVVVEYKMELRHRG